MARTKSIKTEETNIMTEDILSDKIQEEPHVSEISESKVCATGPSYDELLAIVQQLSKEIAALKSAPASASTTTTDAILSKLASRKSDREVSIVHNCETNGGLSTHLDLTGTSIDFQRVGETRLLSWQQFEECLSKYRSFFDRKIILIGPDYKSVAEQYDLPYYDVTKIKLTRESIVNLPGMTIRELEDFIGSLTKEDQETVFSYWLGKAYEKKPGFYDRSKLEVLNRLSDGSFTNLLLVMNGDSVE